VAHTTRQSKRAKRTVKSGKKQAKKAKRPLAKRPAARAVARKKPVARKTPPKNKARSRAAKKGLASASIADLRGVASFYTNEMIVLVRAPIDAVTKAFCGLKRARVCHRDAAGKTVTVSDPCYLIYQLAGHPWTIIDVYASRSSYPNPEDARALSEVLKTKAIFYGNSDTAGVIAYELVEAGKRLERFMDFEETEFESNLGRSAPAEGEDMEDFVRAFFRAQDAFAPSWTSRLGGNCHRPGDKATLPFGGFRPDTLIRLDYVAV